MSRTDKTNPIKAQGTLIAEHDHRNGICDLPSVPTLVNWRNRTNCYWVPDPYRTKWRKYKQYFDSSITSRRAREKRQWRKEI